MKVKFMKIPFLVTMIAVFLSRVYQFVFLRDTVARNNWETIEICLFVIASISVLIMLILSIRPKGVTFSFSFGKSISTSVTGILSGIAIICDSFYNLFKYINEYRDIMLLLLGVSGVIAGIIFIFMSISFIKGKNLFEHKGILTLLPVIWGIFRLLELFFTYYSTSNKVWTVPDEFATIFLLLFLLNLARILADIDHPKKMVYLILCGLSSVMFIFIYTTLNFANQIVLNNTISATDSITLVMDLLIAVYMIMIINAVKLEKKSNKTQITEISTISAETPKVDTTVSAPNVNMSQIDNLVNEIKNENGKE